MLIDKVFLLFEAQVIKSIPVCLTPQEDILIWPKSKDGMYIVKTGYQILCEREDKERASVSSFDAAKIFWSGLWKLKVLNKWKFLFSKHVKIPCQLWKIYWRGKWRCLRSACSSYKSEPETVLHAVWSCRKSRNINQVWGPDFDGLRIAVNRLTSFAVLSRLTSSNAVGSELFAMICWTIWNRWNKCRMKEATAPLYKLFDLAKQHLREFQQRRVKQILQQPPKNSVWKQLDPGLHKTNFDGLKI